MTTLPRLLLLDGHAIAYRAFFAIRSLSTKSGLATNAVYGFIRMTDQLFQQWRPSHMCAVFDGGLPDERMALLPSYKAQREEMPAELDAQFPLIHEYLAAAGIADVQIEREEADDIIATQAVFAKQSGEVLLATSDKDLFQLVDERVAIIPPTKSDQRMGPEDVEKKTGVLPQQIAEWLALIGDSADNIPGVPGIGLKTAAKLLNQFGTLDSLYKNLEQVEREKLRRALAEHEDAVRRNLQMTTLRTNLDVPLDWPLWTVRPNHQDLLSFYRKMEFSSMAKALEAPELF